MHRLAFTLFVFFAAGACAPLLVARPTAAPSLATADAVAAARGEVALARAEWAGDEGVLSLEQGHDAVERAARLARGERQSVRAELLRAGVELRAIATGLGGDHAHGDGHGHDLTPPPERATRVVDLSASQREVRAVSAPQARRTRSVSVGEAERSVRVERLREPAAEPAPEAVERWAIPVREPRVTSRFGPRIDPITGAPGRMHRGVDFGHPTGTPVYATASGRVLMAGWCDRGTGNCIVIEHANGWRSQYFHLSRVTIAAGTTVAQGDAIGEIGSTGRSTGPHLHFQLGPPGEAYDPEPLFGTPVQ